LLYRRDDSIHDLPAAYRLPVTYEANNKALVTKDTERDCVLVRVHQSVELWM